MKILKMFFVLVIGFCFAIFGGVNFICYAESGEREVIEINSSNFFEEFYFNEELFGESGRNFTVKLTEDINLDVGSFAYLEYMQKFDAGEYGFFASERILTACIDGNGKSISGLRVDYDGDVSRDVLALFYNLDGIIVKNLTIKNSTLHAKENVSAFCYSAKDCIFENIKIENVDIYSSKTNGFASKLENCYFINIDILVNAFATGKCFEFAEDITGCGFKTTNIETINVNEGFNDYFENADVFGNWTEAIGSGYSLLNSKIFLSTTNFNSADDNDLGLNNGEEKPSVNLSRQNEEFLLVEIIICSFCLVLFIIKNIIMLLTRKS